MTTLTPYLLFDGRCREAMEFYRSWLRGELVITAVKDSPAKDPMPESQYDKTLNSRLRSSNVDISASDWLRLDRTPVRGNTACLYLAGGTFQELTSLFEKLSEGDEVTDPLSQTSSGPTEHSTINLAYAGCSIRTRRRATTRPEQGRSGAQ